MMMAIMSVCGGRVIAQQMSVFFIKHVLFILTDATSNTQYALVYTRTSVDDKLLYS